MHYITCIFLQNIIIHTHINIKNALFKKKIFFSDSVRKPVKKALVGERQKDLTNLGRERSLPENLNASNFAKCLHYSASTSSKCTKEIHFCDELRMQTNILRKKLDFELYCRTSNFTYKRFLDKSETVNAIVKDSNLNLHRGMQNVQHNQLALNYLHR